MTLLAPVPLVLLVFFSLGAGLVPAAVTVKFRDIMHLYSVFITALMYLTPVIYPMSMLPDWLTGFVMLNPITNIVLMFRNVMLNNTFFGWKSLFVAVVETGIMLAIGFWVFYKNQDNFILNL